MLTGLSGMTGLSAIMGGTSAPPFTPTDIAGLQAWYQADGTRWQDSARTTPATADSDPVGAWDDASVKANHVLQATAAKRPTLKLAIVNGKPVIRYDGVDDWLKIAALATSISADFTLALTVTAYVAPGVVYRIADMANFQIQMNASGAYTNDNSGGPTTSILSPTGQANGVTHVLMFTRTGTTYEFFYDNVSRGTSGGTAPTYTSLTLGASTAGAGPSAVDMGDVLLYNVALSAGNRNSLWSYLQARYGTP